MATKVRDVMTPAPVAVEYGTSIAEVAQTMRDRGVGAVLVVQEQALQGLVTDRDIVVRGIAESIGPDQPVEPLASAELVGVGADEDSTEAVRLMREHAIRRLPVVEHGQVTGMVSLGDLAVEHDPGSALADVSAAKANT